MDPSGHKENYKHRINKEFVCVCNLPAGLAKDRDENIANFRKVSRTLHFMFTCGEITVPSSKFMKA